MAILRLIKEINGNDVVVGAVCQDCNGKFWFNPRISGRKPSRKAWDTPLSCIPSWAKKMADRIEETGCSQ